MHQQSGWQIIYPKTPAGKQYVLDVPEASTAPGTGIILYQFNGGDNQLWNIYPAPDAGDAGYFYIGNKKSQLVLSVPEGGCSAGISGSPARFRPPKVAVCSGRFNRI